MVEKALISSPGEGVVCCIENALFKHESRVTPYPICLHDRVFEGDIEYRVLKQLGALINSLKRQN